MKQIPERIFSVRLGESDNKKLDFISAFMELTLVDTLRKLIRDKYLVIKRKK